MTENDEEIMNIYWLVSDIESLGNFLDVIFTGQKTNDKL